MPRPVSIVAVTYDTYFFVRLLVEKVREFVGEREYEIIIVDRGSRDGTREWLALQSDVRLLTVKPDTKGHGHGEAAEFGARQARHEIIVLLDSDAHPMEANWLELTADKLDEHHRLAGAVFHGAHKGNPAGWYVHPHFMVFHKADLAGEVTLLKVRGEDWDTGEAATVRLLAAGRGVIGYPLVLCERFSVGHPHFPTISAGVFHAWYGTRLSKEKRAVGRETKNAVTDSTYREPLQATLRKAYQLDY
jgi:glycosyltransferase involved in cell wall biosynthesis